MGCGAGWGVLAVVCSSPSMHCGWPILQRSQASVCRDVPAGLCVLASQGIVQAFEPHEGGQLKCLCSVPPQVAYATHASQLLL